MKYISDFPSEQAEEFQKHLLELDEQGKLKEEFLSRYQSNMGAENSLANYIDKHWNENGKKLFIEYTGIETFDDKQTVKRVGVKLNEVTYGSMKYFLWKCSKCQYEWVTKNNDRTSKYKRGCPYCSKYTFIKGKNDLETFCKEHSEFMHLLDEFVGEDEKHNHILPSEISRASNKKVWWKCSNPDCNHKWLATTNDRTSSRKHGCQICGGKICIPGKNDLETYCKQHIELNYILREFIGKDIDGNKILPSEISKSSSKEVWWKCSNPDCRYEWHSRVSSRTYIKSGCPECWKRKTGEASHLRGEALSKWCDTQGEYGAKLKSEFIGKLWNNTPIRIDEINHGSSEKVQWKCTKCHKIWIATPNERTSNRRRGCQYCNPVGTSFPEQYMLNSLKQLFIKAMSRAKTKDTHYEYDIVIPELNLCIEYSGYNWHRDRIDRDELKEAYCKSKGINFLQIYAHQGEIINTDTYTREKIIYQVKNNKNKHILQLQQIIKFILKEYNSEALYDSIDFELAEQQANKVMGKA